MKVNLTFEQVKKLYLDHGYPFDENVINVFGIRNAKWEPDKFNDTLGITYQGKAYEGKVLSFTGTTKPGKSPLMRVDVNKNGVFILRPNFYHNCWHKGLHNGKYKALKQFGNGIFEGWRDNDKDGGFDIGAKLWNDVTGLNFHTTRWDRQVTRVGNFSEGCQVVEVAREYDPIMSIIYNSKQALFSYALFQE